MDIVKFFYVEWQFAKRDGNVDYAKVCKCFYRDLVLKKKREEVSQEFEGIGFTVNLN